MESKNSEEKTSNLNRKIMWLTLCVIIALTTGVISLQQFNKMILATQEMYIGDKPPISTLLRQTALAAESKDDHSSYYSESNPISREKFKETENGTFLISFDIEINGENKVLEGTGWLAEKDKNILYLVSNRHIIEHLKNSQNFRFGRPSIDEDDIWPTNIDWEVHPDSSVDLGVVKVVLSETDIGKVSDEDIQPFIENYQITGDLSANIVGFPMGLHGNNKQITLNHPVKLEQNFRGEFEFEAPVQSGASGSPISILENKNTVVATTKEAFPKLSLDLKEGLIRKDYGVAEPLSQIWNMINILKLKNVNPSISQTPIAASK